MFPDRMVCGFRPADRSNGGRDETHSSGFVWLGKPHTHKHVPSDYSVASLESQNQQRHTKSHSHFTPSHTHLRKRQTTLGICGFVLLSVMIVKQDLRIRSLTIGGHASNNPHMIMKRLAFPVVYFVKHRLP